MTNLITKFRTLSFALVMGAMLMAGTMIPVHQALAQEASSEQRAAMFAQISQLMQLITQLMAQIQMMQSMEGLSDSAKDTTYFPDNSNHQEKLVDIVITSPQSGDVVYTGETIQLNWNETGLNQEEAIVTLSKGRYTKDLNERVKIDDQGVRITLPDYQELGLVTEATYQLKLSVTGVRDGGVKAVSDTVNIRVKPRFSSSDSSQESTAKDCSIQSSKNQIDVGDTVVISWNTNLENWSTINNPNLISLQDGERQVSKTGSREFVGYQTGIMEFSLGSSKDGTVCTTEVNVVENHYTYNNDISVCPYTWTRNLEEGDQGADVRKLQQFLNSDPATQVAFSGPGSVGNEVNDYNQATTKAVSKFQVKYRSEILSPLGLVNPTGVLDNSTKAKANSLCL